jgi:hypothetical protein
VSASWTQKRSRSGDCHGCQHRSVFDLQKSPLGSANMVAKKEKEKKKREKKYTICPFTS